MKNLFLGIILIIISYNSIGQQLEPNESEALINVTVTNFKDAAKPNEPIVFMADSSKKKFTGVTDNKGTFSLLLPKGETYTILYSNYKEQVEYNKLKIDKNEDLETFTVKIKIEPPKTFVLENVLFDTGKATLKPSSNKTLDELVELLKLKTTLVIEIGGHTDNVGKKEFNLQLSKSRANAVRNYIIKKGISANRVIAKGYGDTKPVAANNSEEGRQQNRRTEVNIIKE